MDYFMMDHKKENILTPGATVKDARKKENDSFF
jgi:hypothetical protein